MPRPFFVFFLSFIMHKAGFVNIVGNPNVGKSTLMNALVGERLSIITSKAQTTRHRIMGIVNGEDFQMVYSDTPGACTPTTNCKSRCWSSRAPRWWTPMYCSM